MPSAAEVPIEVPMNRAALARRYGADRRAITHALASAAKRYTRDPTAHQPPPVPLNPGEPNELFDVAVFDAFWAARPGRGRPRATHTTGE